MEELNMEQHEAEDLLSWWFGETIIKKVCFFLYTSSPISLIKPSVTSQVSDQSEFGFGSL